MEYESNSLSYHENEHFEIKEANSGSDIHFNNVTEAISTGHNPCKVHNKNLSSNETTNNWEQRGRAETESANKNVNKLENCSIGGCEVQRDVHVNPDERDKCLAKKEYSLLETKKDDCYEIWNNSPLESEVKEEYVNELGYVELDIKEEDTVAASQQINNASPHNAASPISEACGQWARMIYLCDLCNFKTQHLNSLKQHIKVHKTSSETTASEYEQQNYVIKYERVLKKCENPPEITMYKCNICPYEGKRKSYLKRHMLTHKEVSEFKIYECEICNYTTRHRYGLKSHAVRHKKASELTMFKCKECSFESKYKTSLVNHRRSHTGCKLKAEDVTQRNSR